MIKVFKREVIDGLEDRMRASSAVAYISDINLVEQSVDKTISSLQSCKASANPNQIDLFYFESILASVGWNSNDDVFDKYELWNSRNTAVDKPINLMHVQTDIIGHMTSARAVANSEEISDDIDITKLPDNYDVAVGSVIYRYWEDEEQKEKIKELVEEIKEGEWCVSMECIFPDFDYAVITPNGEHKVIKRTDDSSFLTKHLRVYGGTGEYQGYKVGRLLRNFTFIGKGIVENPANKRSEITTYSFTNEVSAFSGAAASLNILPEEKKIMEKELKYTEAEYQELVKQLQAVASEGIQKELSSAKATIDKLNEQIKTSAAELDLKGEVVKAKDLAIANLTAEAESLKQELSELKSAIAKKELEAVKASRLAKLLEKGVAQEKAVSLVEKCISVAEDAFNELVDAFPAEGKKSESKDMEDMEDEECSKSKDTAEASKELETASVDSKETTLAVPGQSNAESIMSKASAWIQDNLKKTKNK